MPTIARDGPYRLYFYSHEPQEPPHVHVDREVRTAKYWLEPVSLATNRGFGSKELGKIDRLIRRRRDECLEAWNGHFER